MTHARLLAALLVSLSFTAFAQAKSTHQPPPKVINIEEGDVIDGAKAGPEAEVVSATNRPQHEGLIQTRRNFKDKVLASVSEM